MRRDRLFQDTPPQTPAPIRKACRNKDCKWRLMLFEDRIGVVEIVAIAVVERETREPLAEITVVQPSMHFIERDDRDAAAAQRLDHVIEKGGRDLEQTVRLKLFAARRPHVMHREDRAHSAHKGLEREMHAAHVKRVERETIKGIFGLHEMILSRRVLLVHFARRWFVEDEHITTSAFDQLSPCIVNQFRRRKGRDQDCSRGRPGKTGCILP